MSRAVLLLALMDQCFVAALPWIFFRRDGTLNARWFATAAPFMVTIVLLAGSLVGPNAAWMPRSAILAGRHTHALPGKRPIPGGP